MTVVRASRMGTVWLALACLVLGFAAGVFAGTSGEYWELASRLAKPFDQRHPVRTALLALDQSATGRAALDEYIAAVASDLRGSIDAAQIRVSEIGDDYTGHDRTLGALRAVIEGAESACVRSEGHVETSAREVTAVRESVDYLQLLLEDAASACRVPAPSPAPPPTVESPP